MQFSRIGYKVLLQSAVVGRITQIPLPVIGSLVENRCLRLIHHQHTGACIITVGLCQGIDFIHRHVGIEAPGGQSHLMEIIGRKVRTEICPVSPHRPVVVKTIPQEHRLPLPYVITRKQHIAVHVGYFFRNRRLVGISLYSHRHKHGETINKHKGEDRYPPSRNIWRRIVPFILEVRVAHSKRVLRFY